MIILVEQHALALANHRCRHIHAIEEHVIQVLVVEFITAARVGEKEIHLGIVDVVGDIALDIALAVGAPVVELKPLHVLGHITIRPPEVLNVFALGIAQGRQVSQFIFQVALGKPDAGLPQVVVP